MNQQFIGLLVVAMLIVPATLAWNQSECEEVNWNHPDCAWGLPVVNPPSPPSNNESSDHVSHSRSVGDGGGRFTNRIWILDFVGECWNFRTEERGTYRSYHFALSTPPSIYPGSPFLVHFYERLKTVCTTFPLMVHEPSSSLSPYIINIDNEPYVIPPKDLKGVTWIMDGAIFP